MLKRTNKLTALLVAATAVASLAPAGVNAAEYKRISSEEGTIYAAKAFKDGSYVIDGNLVDEDTDAVYYVKDGKFTELEDVDTGSDLELYGEKYLSVDGGDYYIDLATGKVTDDDIEEDQIDDLETTLKKKLKNVDRYDDANILPSVGAKLAGSNYSSVWYELDKTATNHYVVEETGNAATIYTDLEGNYIDADYNLGKIKVITSASGVNKTSNITNSEDKEDAANGSEVAATVAAGRVIAQDSNNIYRFATITVSVATGTSTIKSINGVEVAKATNIFTAETAGTSYSFEVIQKISKAQASDNIDDAKYAKTVTNYFACDDDGTVSTDAQDFVALAKDTDAEVAVVNGKLIAFKADGTKIEAASTALKLKGSLNYLDAESSCEEDYTDYTTDVNGNLYRLDGGYVYKFDNTDDWDKLYKVDGSMDKMSAYDSNNMVVWNEDDEVYSLIGSKATTEDEEVAEDDKVEVVAGWVQAADGTWSYNNADGTKATGWLNLNGTWYYLNAQGTMQTGWANVNGTWYFLQSSGAMKTGWLLDGSTWYYMQASGAMATGWLNDNGTWYYLNANGSMAANTTVDGYVLGANGAWVR